MNSAAATSSSADPSLVVQRRATRFVAVSASLADLLGEAYVQAVCEARSFLTGADRAAFLETARTPVDFYPEAYHKRLIELLPHVGKSCVASFSDSATGATSDAFVANTKTSLAPRSCMGYLRLGEDGRLFLSSKSAHYHTPLGHDFPGYGLIELAKQLGIPNATHNNTRGHVTRIMEEQLVRSAAGLEPDDAAGLKAYLSDESPRRLDRVINLETGSLAAEAALKMVLARFYHIQDGTPEPKYAGRTPVLVVIGDDEGTIQGNYHGTTLLTQAMRGMWAPFLKSLEEAGLLLVRAVRPNVMEDLERVFAEFEKPPYKIAGVFHELIMMNYAARMLSPEFVEAMYALSEKHDAPTVVDEIQTCVWSPEIFMFKEYGVTPTIAVVGKGFPGGEFAASRVLFSKEVDCLPQFGALITNGQAELSSLAYLVTLRWAEANAAVTRAVGDFYEAELRRLAAAYEQHIHCIEGRRHLSGIFFKELGPAQAFAKNLQQGGFDISVQSYKPDCPPCALTKLPLTMGYEAVEFTIDRMNTALQGLSS